MAIVESLKQEWMYYCLPQKMAIARRWPTSGGSTAPELQ